jgi:hypothetical protein
MFKLIAMAALLSAPAASPPAPAAPRCLTRAQAGQMGVVGVAIMVNVARNACRQHLRPTAFLTSTAGTSFVANMVAEGRRQLPVMIAGISTMVAARDPLSPGLLRSMVTGMLAEDAGTDWAQFADPQVCRDADDVIAVMSALSPEQIARASGAFMSLGDTMSRAVLRGVRAHPAYVPVESGSGSRPRPLSMEVPARGQPGADSPPVPGPVIMAPPGPPAPRPPRPPLICPDSE